MAWFKVDDSFYTSRKVLSIPRPQRLAAVGLWALAGAWAAREMTDGVVPEYVLPELGATSRLRRALVEARLWLDRGAAGVEFVNWSDYQPTRAQVERNRAKTAERVARWRNKQALPDSNVGVSNGITNGVSNDVGNPAPDPTRPDPTPINPPSPPGGGKRGARITAGWEPDFDTATKLAAQFPGFDFSGELEKFVDYWIAQPGQKGLKLDWAATWRNWVRRAAADRGFIAAGVQVHSPVRDAMRDSAAAAIREGVEARERAVPMPDSVRQMMRSA